MAARTQAGVGCNRELGVEQPRSAMKDPKHLPHVKSPYAYTDVLKNVLGVPKHTMTLLGIVVLVAGACSPSEPATDRVQSRGATDEVRQQPVDPEVKSFMARYPTFIEGALGTSDTSAFLSIPTPSVSDRPYGPEDGNLLTGSAVFARPPDPTEMPALSRVVVRGRVVAIGLPHFNSTDGRFWDPELHEEPGVTDVARMIVREVLFEVDEVWGSLLPQVLPGVPLRFVVRGGQIAVTLSDEVAGQLGYGPGGVYIISEESAEDLTVGEYAVVFLDVVPILGLYGGKYSAVHELFPASESGFKYIHTDPDTIALAGGPDLNISVSSMKTIIQEQLGLRAYPDAELGLTTPRPTHPPGEDP